MALLKGCAITGVFWGRFTQEEPQNKLANSLQIMKWFEAGKIKPHIHKMYPLEEASKALEEMMGRRVKGKVIVTV